MKRIALFTIISAMFGCGTATYNDNMFRVGGYRKFETRDAVILQMPIENGTSEDVRLVTFCADIIPVGKNEKQIRAMMASSPNFQRVETLVPKNSKTVVTVIYFKNKFLKPDQIHCRHYQQASPGR